MRAGSSACARAALCFAGEPVAGGLQIRSGSRSNSRRSIALEAWIEPLPTGLCLIGPNLTCRSGVPPMQQNSWLCAAPWSLCCMHRRSSEQAATSGARVWRWHRDAGSSRPSFARIVAFARGMPRPTARPPRVAALQRARGRASPPDPKPIPVHGPSAGPASDVVVEGDRGAQRALRFASYHLISAANPEDAHVSIGARA